MSLLRPTVGDLMDRQCVLRLKCQAAAERGIPCRHWAEEMAAIADRLGELLKADSRRTLIRPLQEQLFKVHGKLFGIVDWMDRWFPVEDYDKKPLAIEIADRSREAYYLNRERIRLREEIDKALEEYEGPEKL